MKQTFICARCGRKVTEYPALSRRDNKSYVCTPCGQMEALDDFFGFVKGGEKHDKRKK